MSRHISDELPFLLTGDATRDVVMEAASHLRTCVDCQQELVSAVIAHASLTSAHRFAPEIVAADHAETEPEPAEPAMLPDLSRVFADARAEASTPDAPTNAARPGDDLARRRVRRRLVAVVAAAAVVVGGGVSYAVLGDDAPSGPASRTVALDGISDATDGRVKLVGDSRMIVDATALPKLSPDHQYEVWLTDEDSRQPVGYLRDGTAEISVPSTVMSRYKGIAVSVQRNGQTAFSGRVVLSGTYG